MKEKLIQAYNELQFVYVKGSDNLKHMAISMEILERVINDLPDSEEEENK